LITQVEPCGRDWCTCVNGVGQLKVILFYFTCQIGLIYRNALLAQFMTPPFRPAFFAKTVQPATLINVKQLFCSNKQNFVFIALMKIKLA